MTNKLTGKAEREYANSGFSTRYTWIQALEYKPSNISIKTRNKNAPPMYSVKKTTVVIRLQLAIPTVI